LLTITTKEEIMRVLNILLTTCVIGTSGLGLAQTIGGYGSYLDTDDAGDAYGGGLQLTLPMGEILYIAARGTYYSGLEYTTALREGVVPVNAEADLTLLDLGIGLQHGVGEATTVLYGDAGISFLFTDADFEINNFPAEADWDDDEGWYATLGVRTGEDVQGFLEVQYRSLSSDLSSETSNQLDSISDDVTLDHFAVNLGVLVRW
jgi:hypothetical protein